VQRQWSDAYGNGYAARLSFFLLLLFLLAGCAAPPIQSAPTGDALRIENPVARPAPAGQNSAAYFTIINPSPEGDHLLSAASGVAMFTELHETYSENGVMRMRHHADGVPVPALASLAFAPGGNHVMLMKLRQELTPGQTFTLTLTFSDAGEIEVTVPVRDQQ